jgi:hypothetical protein
MNTANPYAPPRASVEDVTSSAATLAERGTRLGVDALLIFGEARQCIHDKIAGTIVIKA